MRRKGRSPLRSGLGLDARRCMQRRGGRDPRSELVAIQELDDLAVRTGDECDTDLGGWLATERRGAWRGTRDTAGCERAGVGRIHVSDTQAEVQQRAFGWLFAGVPPPALGLHGGTRAEHFDV